VRNAVIVSIDHLVVCQNQLWISLFLTHSPSQSINPRGRSTRISIKCRTTSIPNMAFSFYELHSQCMRRSDLSKFGRYPILYRHCCLFRHHSLGYGPVNVLYCGEVVLRLNAYSLIRSIDRYQSLHVSRFAYLFDTPFSACEIRYGIR